MLHLTRCLFRPIRSPSHLLFAVSYKFTAEMSHTAMSARLAGKTILITGASSGIGRSTAIEFSRTSPDIKLILAARREETLKELAKSIESESGGQTKVLPVRLDVSSSSDVNGFIERLPKDWRGIDVLVNNAYCSLFFGKYELIN